MTYCPGTLAALCTTCHARTRLGMPMAPPITADGCPSYVFAPPTQAGMLKAGSGEPGRWAAADPGSGRWDAGELS